MFTVTPQVVNTATFEAYSDVSENTSSADDWPTQLGLGGVAGKTFPYINLSGYLPMGRMSPLARTARNTFVITDAHSLKRRAHNVRMVAQLVRTQVNTFGPGLPSGAFYFGSNLTSLPGIVGTGLSSAGFLLGGVESADVSIVPSPSYFRNWSLITAAQDTWEIRAGLTMSFGLNMLTAAPRTERYNRQSTVDLSVLNPANGRLGALVFAGRDGYGSAFQPTVMKPAAELVAGLEPARQPHGGGATRVRNELPRLPAQRRPVGHTRLHRAHRPTLLRTPNWNQPFSSATACPPAGCCRT